MTGAALVCIAYLALATIAALTLPYPGTADARQHLDYIYQVSIGQIPEPFGHPLFPDNPWRQYASAHPPLYYALMSVFVGGMLPDHIGDAVAVVRFVNIVFGAGTVAAISWCGYEIGGRRRVSLSVGMGAISASSFTMIRFGAEVYNDMLVALAAALLTALTARIVTRGISWPLAVTTVLVCTVGLGVKATFIVPLAACLGMIGLVGLIKIVRHEVRAGATHIGVVVGSLAVAIASNAWFYLLNAERSGSWYRSTPKMPVPGREEWSWLEVIVDPQFWFVIGTGYTGRDSAIGFTVIATLIIAVLSGATVLIVGLGIVRTRKQLNWSRVAMIFVLALQLVGTFATQLSHANGYGEVNFRYFLPVMAAVAYLLAAGATGFGRRGDALLMAAAAFLAFASVVTCVAYGARRLEVTGLAAINPMTIAAHNGHSPALVVIAIIVALGAASAVLWHLSSTDSDQGVAVKTAATA